MTCSIAGCSKGALARGWCSTHYLRWRRLGDAEAKVQRCAQDHSPLQWIKDNSSFSGDDCLIWPFAQFKNGYANIQGRSACRVMCEQVHGPAPTCRHQTAHSCGKGTKGCISPRHVRWATQSENEADKKLHGTSRKGKKKA